MNNQDEISQDISNQLKGAGSKAGNAAARSINKKASGLGKRLAKQTAKAAFHIAKAAVSIILNVIGVLISPVGIGIFILIMVIICSSWLLNVFKVNNQEYQQEVLTSSGAYDTANALAAVFYEKYADQSFYYVLSLPEEKNDEEYSGKTYEQLGGKPETTGIQQASQTNYIEDVDNYEENIKLSAGALTVLDTKLNNAGSTGYYYPEQFIKLLAIDFSDEDCRLERTTDENGNEKSVDISGCKLKNLSDLNKSEKSITVKDGEKTDDGQVMSEDLCSSLNGSFKNSSCTYTVKIDGVDVLSTKYEKVGETYQKTAEQTESVSDYGLGSLVEYEAHYQPSRINNYKITDTIVVDDNWTFDSANGTTPYEVVNYSSLSSDEQKEIINKYRNPSASATSTYTKSVTKKSTNNEGLLVTGETGLYPVENQIVYKDWVLLENYNDVSKWEQWGVSEPLVSTGVLDTEIVYAISKAVVYFQDEPIDFNVSETWTDLETAVHEQTASYLKDYSSSKATNHNTYKVADYPNAEGLKKLYGANGTFLGYIKDDPKWVEGNFKEEGSPTPTKSTKQVPNIVDNDDTYCMQRYGTITSYCLAGSHTDGKKTETTYSISYSATYTPGYWEYTLVRDTDGNPTSSTGKIYEEEVHSCSIKDSNTSSSTNGRNECRSQLGNYFMSDSQAKNYGKEDSKNNWRYSPSYLFTISAHAEGQLQVRLVSHGRSNITSSQEDFDYLRGYIQNYEAYIPSAGASFTCTANENGDDTMMSQTYSDIDFCECDETSPYCIAYNGQGLTYMKQFGIANMSDAQLNKINSVLGITENESSSNKVLYSESVVEIPSSVNSSTKQTLSKIATEYGDAIEKASKKYGVDASLLKAMIATAQIENTKYVECDGSCTYEDIFIFDEVVSGKRTVRDVTINPNGTKEEIVEAMAVKMQRLMEKHYGNLLVSLLEYNLGEETLDTLINVYSKETGLPKEEILSDEYDTGWNHYLLEILENTTEYGVSPLSTASTDYIQDIITNLGTTALVKWTRKPTNADSGAKSEYIEDGSSTKVFIWRKSDIYDRADMNSKKSTYNAQVITALYNLRKNNGEGYKKYWKILTSNQKGAIENVENTFQNSEGNNVSVEGDYILTAYYINENGEYDRTKNQPSNAVKMTYSGDSQTVEQYIKMMFAFDSEETYIDIDVMSGDYWMSKFGKMDVQPDYKTIVGRGLEAPAEEYTTIKKAGEYTGTLFGSATKTAWIIKTEEDADIVSITSNGEVVSADGDRVDVYLEDYDTTISYTGLKDISVKQGDKIKDLVVKGSSGNKKKLLGKSSGQVAIFVYHDEGYYDMEEFLKTATSDLSIGSGIVSGYLGGACLSYEESQALWAIINADLRTSGGVAFNCTRFTNYMITEMWGSDFYAPVYGDGKDKVDKIVEAFADKGVVKKTVEELNDNEENMAFSYSDGSYGHTGWIDEFVRDSSMEGGGYVVVSEGNVGSNSLIRLKQKYTYDEWYSVIGKHCTFAVRT